MVSLLAEQYFTDSSKLIIAVPHMRIKYRMKRHNIDKVDKIAMQSRAKGSNLIILPSQFNLGPVIDGVTGNALKDFKKTYAERIPGQTTNILTNIAEKYNLLIAAGPIIERAGPRLFLSSTLIAPFSGVINRHRKIVLSDIEQQILSPGHELTIYDAGVRMGILIEDDVMLPEIAHILSFMDIDILVIYQRLNKQFSRYKCLLVSRAIENNSYVIGVGGIVSYNNEDILEIPSMIIDPEGNIVDEVRDFEERISIIEIEKKGTKRKSVKKDIPILKKIISYYRKTIPAISNNSY